MVHKLKYQIVALLLLLGIVLCVGGTYFKLTLAMDPPASTNQSLALGQWVYFQISGGAKYYIGSYLGVYVISTGGCDKMEVDTGTGTQHCVHQAVQNGWGVLYNAVPIQDGNPHPFIVNDIYGIIPLENNVNGQNSYGVAEISGSVFGSGHTWSQKTPKWETKAGAIGVDLVLYSPDGKGVIYPDQNAIYK